MGWVLKTTTRRGMEHHQRIMKDGTFLNIYAYPSTKPTKPNGTRPQDCQIEIVRPSGETRSKGRYEGVAYAKRLVLGWYKELAGLKAAE